MTVPIIPLNESTITLVNAFGFGASRLEHSIEQVGWLVKFSWDIEHLQEFLEQGYSPAVLINSKPDWYFYDENDRLNPWMQIDSAYLEGEI